MEPRFKSIDFDTLHSKDEFEKNKQVMTVSDELAYNIASVCILRKDNLFERICDVFFKDDFFYYAPPHVSEEFKNYKHMNFDQLLEAFESRNKDIVIESGLPNFMDYGLSLKFVLQKMDDDPEEIFYFISIQKILGVINKAYYNEKELGNELGKDWEYFIMNTPKGSSMLELFKGSCEIQDFKAKGLFSKGYIKACIRKPQLLIDIQKRINERIVNKNLLFVILPHESLDYSKEEPLLMEWKFTNPGNKSGKEYQEAERNFVFAAKDKNEFVFESNHSTKDKDASEAIKYFKSAGICAYLLKAK